MRVVLAHEYFRRACHHGEPTGCGPLGYMYQKGQIVPKDLERAIALFKRPCENGEANVCVGFGELYEVEKRVPTSALIWYGKACDEGEPEGCAAEQRVSGK
jgi:TPR repeat protein